MYLLGTIYNFEQRLHQLPSTTGDLQNFYEEASVYGEIPYLSLRWDKEFAKKEWIFNWSPTEISERNIISSLSASIVSSGSEVSSDGFLYVTPSGLPNGVYSFPVYAGSSSGLLADDDNIFYGNIEDAGDHTSNGYFSIEINGSGYYIPLYSGEASFGSFSTISGNYDAGTGAFVSAGYVLVNINDEQLSFLPIYEKE